MGIIIINSFYKTFIFILFFTLNISFSYGANDTITTTQSLTGNQTLVSTGGKFELGFFKPGNSLNYYVGMWYKKDSLQTILWVANRDAPVSDKFSSQLKIIDGNLVLLDGSRTQIWSTNMNPSSSNSILAVLRDDGNLVLIDGLTSNGSNSNVLNAMPIWESFNHPTDTLFPGAKIAYNKLTKRKRMLTSWKNFEDPGMGLFSYEIDPKGSQLMIKFNGSESYWSTGAWNGEFFSSVPEMTKDDVYNFSYIAYIDKENETYFTYSFFDTSIQARLVMDTSGQIEVFLWLGHIPEWSLFWSQPQQRRHCQSDAYCGAFSVCNQNSSPYCNCLTGFTPTPRFANNYSADCVRIVDLECGNADLARGKKNRFLMSSHMGLPDFPQSVAVASVEECEANCLNNCSCTAYAYYDNGCSIWNGVLVNLKQLSLDDGNGKVIYVRVSSSAFSSAKSGVDIGIVVGCIVGVLALLGLPFVVMRRRTWRTWLAGPPKALEGSLVAFRYKDLKSATKNFSEKLGSGGFGSVFKGTLYNSTVVAVKRLEGISQGEKQFRAEVNTVGTIQHVNLVRLRGFCSEGKKNLLVYEYMPNGSLNSHLFHAKDSKVLDWEKRYQIALGTARGLAYLHESCRDCIIHCDIKPENILLDAEFCPKVADFGLAKLFGHEFSRVLTTMRGTRGYLAPEWISGVAITSKADVYSYGMMLFELVSGRRNTELQLNREVIFFPTEAARVTTREGDLISLLDHRLDNIADAEEVTRICRVACWCIQDEENLRPSMGQVVQILEGVLDIKLPQMPQSLHVFAHNQEEHMLYFTELSSGLSSHAQLHPLNPRIE